MALALGVAGCGAATAAPVGSPHPGRVSVPSRESSGPASQKPATPRSMHPAEAGLTKPALDRALEKPAPTKPSVSYSAPLGAPAAVPVYYFGASTGGHVYLTIDDGWFPSTRTLSIMQHDHLPLTAFLIANAAQEHLAFWKAFVASGGQIEDHTLSHPDLAMVPYDTVVTQWNQPRLDYQKWFGVSPTVGRPPYGGLDATVAQGAHAAGLNAIVMWSAIMGPKGLSTWNHGPLTSGEIVLLHWDPGLSVELTKLLAIVKADHLTVAPLLSGLPASAG